MVDERQRLSLLRGDTAEWRLWSLVAEFANRLNEENWALIGGQMVALHVHLAGAKPLRTTTDVDIVADVVGDRSSFHACKAAASDIGLDAQPSITGQTLHRFGGTAGQLDLMVADHLPPVVMRQFTKPAPISVAGGQRALDRRITVDINTESGPAKVPLPDHIGALVVKARASIADTRDRERHHTDLAQLSALIDDPIALSDRLDKKERRYLRRVRLDDTVTKQPWLQLDERSRQPALDAWLTLVEE